MIKRLRPWLTRLYPRSWRIRYEEEFTALLEESLNSPLDVLDILLGALDAHLLLLSGESFTWREMNMLNKIRTAILIVFAADIGFVIAGLMLILGAVASTLAVWKVVSRTDIEQETFRAIKRSITVQIYQFDYWPAVVTTFAMFVMLAVTVTWSWLAFASAADFGETRLRKTTFSAKWPTLFHAKGSQVPVASAPCPGCTSRGLVGSGVGPSFLSLTSL